MVARFISLNHLAQPSHMSGDMAGDMGVPAAVCRWNVTVSQPGEA